MHAIMRLYSEWDTVMQWYLLNIKDNIDGYFAEAALMRDLISSLEEGTLSAET